LSPRAFAGWWPDARPFPARIASDEQDGRKFCATNRAGCRSSRGGTIPDAPRVWIHAPALLRGSNKKGRQNHDRTAPTQIAFSTSLPDLLYTRPDVTEAARQAPPRLGTPLCVVDDGRPLEVVQ